MKAFAFKAYGATGRTIKGVREARDKAELRDLLLAEGLTPIVIAPKALQGSLRARTFVLSDAAAAAFAADLARFLRSGLSLGQAFSVLERTAGDRRAARLAAALKDELLTGRSLSKALDIASGPTGRLLQALAKAGEATGRLADILEGGARGLKSSALLKRRLLTLSIYPLFVTLMAIGAVMLFAFAVLPALEPAFESVSADLPTATKVVLTAGKGLRGAAPFLVAAVATCSLALTAIPKAREWGAGLVHQILLSPLGGGVLQDAVFASLSQRLAVALGAGVPAVAAFRVSIAAIGIGPIREALQAQESKLREGGRLSEALGASGHAPELLRSLMSVGETSTDLPRVLAEAGETLAARAHEKTERLLAVLTPSIVLVIGFFVGAIVLVVFQGLLSISDVVDL